MRFRLNPLKVGLNSTDEKRHELPLRYISWPERPIISKNTRIILMEKRVLWLLDFSRIY